MSLDNEGRRTFMLAMGRAIVFGGLSGTVAALLCRRRQALAAGSDCTGPNQCVSCPELLRCGLPAASEVLTITTGTSVWQLDPSLCIQCGGCAVNCVLEPSAVKAVNAHDICGYCKLCFGYFQPDIPLLDEGAEHQLCPVGAIERTFIENPYYEYTIDEERCIACGTCVEACAAFGNGSFYLQVRHDRCQGCNECSIARRCPAGAYRRVPAAQPYLNKEAGGS